MTLRVFHFFLTICLLFTMGFSFLAVTAAVNLKAAAIGVWLFDEEDRDTAKDSSEQGNDGILMGEPKWEEDIKSIMNNGFSKTLGISAVLPSGKLITFWASIKRDVLLGE